MNVVAIMGSPLGMKGNTAHLLKGAIEGCEAAGATVKLFEIAKLKIAPCVGCAKCHKTGRCIIKDDYEAVKGAMQSADAILLASPNYIHSVTAQMKALFDRSSCSIHCQSFDGKYGAAVATSGGPDDGEVGKYMLLYLASLGCWTVGSTSAEAKDVLDPAARVKAVAEARALGQNLVEAAIAKKTYPDQAKARAPFVERMKSLVTLRGQDWPYELTYWKSQGHL